MRRSRRRADAEDRDHTGSAPYRSHWATLMGGLALVRRKGLFGITWGTPGADTWDYSQSWNRGLELGSPSAIDEPYRQHASIAIAMSIFVGDAASIEWELFKAGNKDDPIESDPLLDLLANPSPMFSGYQLWVGTYLARKLFGASAWYYPDVQLGNRGGLKATQGARGQILLIDPRALIRSPHSKGQWKVRVRGIAEPLDDRFLTIFMRPNPYKPGTWCSEIESVLVEVEADYAAAQYNRAFFRDQFGMPSGLLVPHENDTTGPTERQEFMKRFNEDAQRQRRNVGAVPPGWKWQDVGVSMKDMEFRGLREYARELILSAIGPVPPFMVGVLDKANFANAREQREMYWTGPQPRFLAEIQSKLNSDFLPKVGRAGFELHPCWEKVKALLENLAEKVDVAAKMFAMGFTKRQINERLELGMDVDKMEDADVGYLAFNVVPVSQVLNPPEPPPIETVPPPPADAAKALPPHVTKDEVRRAAQWRTIVANARDIEMRFDKMIRKHMQSIEREILESVNGIRGWKAVQTKAGADDLLPDWNKLKAQLRVDAAPLQKAAILRGADSILAMLEGDAAFSMATPTVIGKLLELQFKITRIDTTIQIDVRSELVEGISKGESVAQLAARVRTVMDASKGRSMTIARTETGFAYNTGRNEAMKQAGIQKREWLTARDIRVRDSHAGDAPTGESVDGQIRDLGDPFVMASGAKLMYPQDPSGAAGEVINCRCVEVPVIGGGQ